MSCDLLDQSPALKTYPREKRSTSRSRSVDTSQYYEKKIKSSVSSSSGESFNSCGVDFTEHRFALKVQTYLRSIEQLGEITDLKFHFGHMILKTEDGEFSVEVNEQGMVPLVSLEEDIQTNSGFLLYTYNSTAKGLNHKYNYCSLLYFSDIYNTSKNKVFILQASMKKPYGTPSFTPVRIRTSDNPKLVSPNSRFIGMFDTQPIIRTVITHLTQHMQAYYISQSDLSLDLSTNEQQAAVFCFLPYKACD